MTPPPDVVFSNHSNRKRDCSRSLYEAVNDANSRVEHPLKLKIKVRRYDNIFSIFSQPDVNQTATVGDMAPCSPFNEGAGCVPTVMTSSAVASPMSVSDEESKIVVVVPEVPRDKTDNRSQIDNPSTTVPDVAAGKSYFLGYHLEDISDAEEDSATPVPMAYACSVTSSGLATESETRFGIPRSLISYPTVALSASYCSLAEPVQSQVTDDVSADDYCISDGPPCLMAESVSASRTTGVDDCTAEIVTSPGSPSSATSDEPPPRIETRMCCVVLDKIDSAVVYRSSDDSAPSAVHGVVDDRATLVAETLERQLASTTMTADSAVVSVAPVAVDVEETERPTKHGPSPLQEKIGHRREDLYNVIPDDFVSNQICVCRNIVFNIVVSLTTVRQPSWQSINPSISIF